ncbi:MAG: WD40/YVTN/BNR-like repeat-containing protein, partial [Bacteroidota bacterium]
APDNPQVIYVAAPGPLWSDSPHRGLYKSTDGGKTWSKILYVDSKTGCAEVLIDPQQPGTIYASMWQFRRKPFAFESGGPGSGLFKSTDGGTTWTKITKGLPTGEFGRIAMTLAPSDPKRLLAIVEAKKTSLYLSTDGGQTWEERSTNGNVEARPFYFSTIVVDPTDPKRVYRPAFSLSISDDGGLSWSEASTSSGWVHSDHHALWINPNNTSQMYLGTDGGVYMSLDKGNNYIFLNSLPVSQFYHVSIDKAEPYNVYGGLQDNGSWVAPSQSIGGIENGDWQCVGFGDGFWVQPDPSDTSIVYSEYQGGHASRLNRVTNEYADIQPKENPGDPKFRFNWNTPLWSSPNNPDFLYMASQFLFRTKNKGITWERISPDLTTNDPAKQKQEQSGGVTTDNTSAENHCTIFTLAEAWGDPNTIWVGTDDGNLQLTTDGGKVWKKVNPVVKGIPNGTWVSSIEPSRFDKQTVYLTLDNHMYGDMNTYVVVSRDMGKTWSSLNSSTINGSYAHKIRQDLVNKELLFLGTEAGLFISLDGGDHFTAFTAKVPPVAVRDIQIHPTRHDLILATHGRGILIIDDISPIRQLSAELLEKEFALLPVKDYVFSSGRYNGAFPSAGGFIGPNSPEDLQIVYYLKDRVTSGDFKLEIFDKDGRFISKIPATKRKGLNKIGWDPRMKPPKVAVGVKVDGSGFFGPRCDTGIYTIRLTKAGKSVETKVRIGEDPATPHSAADRALQRKTTMELFDASEDLAFLNERVYVSAQQARLLADSAQGSLKKSLLSYAVKMDTIRKELVATKPGLAITGEEMIRERLSELYSGVLSYRGRPSDSQLDKFTRLLGEIDVQQQKADAVWSKDLPALNAGLQKAGLEQIKLVTREQFDKKSDDGSLGGNKNWNYRNIWVY